MRTIIIFLTSILLILIGCETWDSSADGSIKGVVTDFATGNVIEGVTIELLGENLSDVTDSNGTYQITGIPEGRFTVQAIMVTYVVSVKSRIEIYADETTVLNFRLAHSDAVGKISGVVSNAVNGLAIPDAQVSIVGEHFTEITDTSGYYLIENIPAGFYSMNAIATGYYISASYVVEVHADSITTAHFALSPEFNDPGVMRIILTWGENPNDIDSHLKTPAINDEYFHIYYASIGDSLNAPFVWLDIDDIDGYGPETMTIYEAYEGDYHYYVHKYAGEGPLTASGAKASIYNSEGLQQSFDIPTSGEGIYWNVCLINAETGVVTPINLIQDMEPGRPDLSSRTAGSK
ncbi:carboxypeptidase regulatory-like domain-containing protein [bacterium]|nr:carboxypeptidase regulatory-like domain-containing protein [bacterium]